MTDDDHRPLLWILDAERAPLRPLAALVHDWATVVHYEERDAPDWEHPPDAILLSTDIPGGAGGDAFAALVETAGHIPLLAVTRVRSLAQAVAFFRAGAADYLALPLDESHLRERIGAALDRATRLAMGGVVVELEPVDDDAGDIELNLIAGPPPEEEDILARLTGEIQPEAPVLPATAVDGDGDGDEDPEPVDGLPIPSLWEELPCGLIVFDSTGNMVFSNALGLDLFGHPSIAELQEALENRRGDFAALGVNGRAVPDNQWPHELAVKSRTPRAALLSLERPDKRRLWLRIDCMPHLSEGKIARLSMTVVNLTGDIPAPFGQPARTTPADNGSGRKGKRKKRGK